MCSSGSSGMPSPTDCDGDISASSPAAPVPELLVVAEKLKQTSPNIQNLHHPVKEEVITPNVVILGVTLPPSMKQEEVYSKGPEVLDKRTTRFYVNSTYTTEDAFSTSSFGSHRVQDVSTDSIHTIAQEMSNVSKHKFEVLELETPGRAVSSIFIMMFCLLGLTIMAMIILTVVFNYGLLLMLVMIVIIFILIVILTNFCAMMYQL